ncbi:1,4-dihydroxy-6-naphtoate synthase [Frankia canadensis]|uniref:1,4-dihydroxy-6-naphtoate synthase n=1 Tax=Frankia canadensis TaxID=1836972 RepID=A0A2I2L0R2_9ACTN|nr:1,4-dihydroxy-6-naphthoate synthase [Frankia canadensis]SNQ51467.1 1,4-dihydroxy-6-naphtoate synthase [Frankia canadensis]SOU58757.1 1,4-dihydroxy-6-naphtoate synthase [Frankia canadensis]
MSGHQAGDAGDAAETTAAAGWGALSLAISPCPNDTFAFHALAHGLVPGAPAVEVTFADIDVLNGRAAQRRDDLVKVSYAALPWLLADYQLLTAGGALGRGCGPLVLTAGRADLRGARVAIPGTRTTAYLLFRLWAVDQGVASIDVLPFEKIMPAVRDGRYDAGLVIHESRFTYPSYGLTALADLGDWWEARTSLPIPLGAILARRELDGAALSAAVRASVAAAFADPAASADYVLAHSQELAPDVVDAHIKLYVNEFSLDLGDEGFSAIETLLTQAADADLVPRLAQPLR